MVFRRAHGVAYVDKIPGYGWYISSIVVDADYRRHGIGSKIMERIIMNCGDRPIYLYATPELGTDIKVLKRFYRKFGFSTLPSKEWAKMNAFPLKANMVLR